MNYGSGSASKHRVWIRAETRDLWGLCLRSNLMNHSERFRGSKLVNGKCKQPLFASTWRAVNRISKYCPFSSNQNVFSSSFDCYLQHLSPDLCQYFLQHLRYWNLEYMYGRVSKLVESVYCVFHSYRNNDRVGCLLSFDESNIKNRQRIWYYSLIPISF